MWIILFFINYAIYLLIILVFVLESYKSYVFPFIVKWNEKMYWFVVWVCLVRCWLHDCMTAWWYDISCLISILILFFFGKNLSYSFICMVVTGKISMSFLKGECCKERKKICMKWGYFEIEILFVWNMKNTFEWMPK